MSEPIKDGDLVQVIRPTPCCGSTVGMGSVYTAIWVGGIEMQCLCCGDVFAATLVASEATQHPELGFQLHGHLLGRVKRIPPFPELVDERHDEEITA